MGHNGEISCKNGTLVKINRRMKKPGTAGMHAMDIASNIWTGKVPLVILHVSL